MHHLSRRPIAILLCALLLALPLLSGVAAAPAADSVVSIPGLEYTPSVVVVLAGESITWSNNDGSAHGAISDTPGAFDTGVLGPGTSATITFNTAGSFTYSCNVHGNSMTGTVLVHETRLEISMYNYTNYPQTLTVLEGETILWNNRDNEQHDADPIFVTPPVNAGEGRTEVMNTPGTFPYECSLHPGMTGTVIVKQIQGKIYLPLARH